MYSLYCNIAEWILFSGWYGMINSRLKSSVTITCDNHNITTTNNTINTTTNTNYHKYYNTWQFHGFRVWFFLSHLNQTASIIFLSTWSKWNRLLSVGYRQDFSFCFSFYTLKPSSICDISFPSSTWLKRNSLLFTSHWQAVRVMRTKEGAGIIIIK